MFLLLVSLKTIWNSILFNERILCLYSPVGCTGGYWRDYRRTMGKEWNWNWRGYVGPIIPFNISTPCYCPSPVQLLSLFLLLLRLLWLHPSMCHQCKWKVVVNGRGKVKKPSQSARRLFCLCLDGWFVKIQQLHQRQRAVYKEIDNCNFLSPLTE